MNARRLNEMLGKASEIKTHISEDNDSIMEFLKKNPNVEVIEMKFSSAFNGDRIWYPTLIIYKEDE
jgi:hypothetical protein